MTKYAMIILAFHLSCAFAVQGETRAKSSKKRITSKMERKKVEAMVLKYKKLNKLKKKSIYQKRKNEN